MCVYTARQTLFLYHGGMAKSTLGFAVSRSDFPSLTEQSVYLDTAATSLTPEPVLAAMDEYYRGYRASTHRGLYASALHATEAYEKARADVARFVGADADEIVFTSGATGSANMLTYALEQTLNLAEGDEIVTTVMEHHASLIPLQELAQRRTLTLKHIPLDGFSLDYSAAEKLFTERTKLVSVMLASNVLGTVNDVARIAELAHKVGAVMVVDATAAVGHLPVNIRGLECDFLYFSGHKMCGPTGVGVLYGKKERLEALKPGFFGGGIVDEVTRTSATYTDASHRFEPGTPNIAGAIGLGAAVTYLTEIGLKNIQEHIRELTGYAYETLASINGVKLYSSSVPLIHGLRNPVLTEDSNGVENVGIVSFTLAGVHPHDVAQVCADNGVAIRAGHHCAQPVHTTLGVPATARASFYLYNTKEDVNALRLCIEKAVSLFTTY
jgi:cysteine desulfurase/selenocysteine lyase